MQHFNPHPGQMPMIMQYRGLPRQVYLLLICRIITAMGMFVFPFITLFLSSRLHFDDAQIGRYLLLVSLTTVPGALLGGKLADRYRRKYVYIAVVIVSDIFYTLAGFMCDQLTVIWLILAGFAFLNMGNPIVAAMMMDLTTPDNRRESFSLIYLGFNIGFAVGPLLAGLLFENYTPWLFWGQSLLTLFSALLVGLLIKDAPLDEEEQRRIAADYSRRRERAAVGSLFRQLCAAPLVAGFALLCACYAFGYAQVNYMLPLQMEDLFGISLGSKYFGAIWSLNGLLVFILTPLTVLLCKRFSALFSLGLSGCCYALGFALYALAGQLLPMYGLVLVWTAGEVIAATHSGVFIADHAPMSHRARFQSLYDVTQGLGRAVGPLVMGEYLLRHSISSAWLVVGGVSLVAALAFFIMDKRQQH